MPFPRRTNPNNRRCILPPLAMAASGLTLTACTLTPAPPASNHRRYLASCSQLAPALWVGLDGTGSSKAKAITDERLAAVEQLVTRTAVCSGRLRVVVFSSSSVASKTLLDTALVPKGATTQARMKRVPELVADATASVRKQYADAAADLPGGGSDISGQWRQIADWKRQLGRDLRAEAFVFTDGMENVERRVGGRTFTTAKAMRLAATTPVPKLTDVSLTVAGIGRVAKKPPRSSAVEGLVTFYSALCRKSGAASCTVVTDVAQAGR